MTQCADDRNKKLIGQLADQTIKHWGIVGRELAQRAGISETHLSQFRNGKTNIGDDKLAQLLEAMEDLAPGSRSYFCTLLVNSHSVQKYFFSQLVGEAVDLKQLVASMDWVELAELMDAIAKAMKNHNKIRALTISERQALPL